MENMSSKRKEKSKDILDQGDMNKRRKIHAVNESQNVTTKTDNFLAPLNAFILKAGIQKVRLQIFENQLKKFGGALSNDFSSSVTHLIVDDKMEIDRLCRILKLDFPPDDVPIVKTSWLSACFKEKMLVDIKDHALEIAEFSSKSEEKESKEETKPAPETGDKTDISTDSKPQFPKVGMIFGHHEHKGKTTTTSDDDESDYCPSDGETRKSNMSDDPETSSSQTPLPVKHLPKGNWVCTQSSKVQVENHNQHITDKLEEMVKTYESTNDKWRAFSYQKAIQVLRRQKKAIASFEEAVALPGVGKRLAEKIWEIAESGELRKLNEFKSSDDIRVMELFMNVWGAGATTARTWYQQGHRTLEDLKDKANLTYQQKIGLRLYDDILDRMPREEAGEIEQVVRVAAESLLEGVIVQACGSYRRGKATCGDIDLLITHPDGKSHKGLFGKVLAKLKDDGFLTDDLVTSEDNDNQKKYLGVCKLPGQARRHRRIDIIVVPYDEYACALVYFTGSAHFNRSLRHLAKKMGMSLSEHSLNKGVVRNGAEKVYEGKPVPTPTEESVFLKLGVPFRPPEERDH